MSKSGMLRFDSFEALQQHMTRDSSTKAPKEKDILPAVIDALRSHPRVHFAERVNKGFGQLVRPNNKQAVSEPMAWGYKHALDITGALKGGVRLEVEVKRPGEKPTDEQQATIEGMRQNGCCAFWCDSARAALDELERFLSDCS